MKTDQQKFKIFIRDQEPYLSYCYQNIPVLKRVSFNTFCNFAYSHSKV